MEEGGGAATFEEMVRPTRFGAHPARNITVRMQPDGDDDADAGAQMKIEARDVPATNNVRFLLEGVDEGFCNAVVRAIETEIPYMAISVVYWNKNSSVRDDRTLQHSLSMVRLRVADYFKTITAFKYADECDCPVYPIGAVVGGGGCDRCRVCFTLKKRNTDRLSMPVYTGDLQSSNPLVSILEPRSLLVQLGQHQEIDLVAVARKGVAKGSRSAQYMCTAAAWFRPVAHISLPIRASLNAKQQDEVVKACAYQVLDRVDNRVRVARPLDCVMCNECVHASEHWNVEDLRVKVSPSSDRFQVFIESFGSLAGRAVVRAACRAMTSKIDRLLALPMFS